MGRSWGDAQALSPSGACGGLPRGAATKVGARHQDRSAGVLRPVQNEVVARPPVIEEEGPIPGALDPLQELLGDDLVGVDVRQVERRHAPGDAFDGLHYISSRTSTRWPVNAAAAAIGGLIR